MKILFLGYWGANEGLSQSTINPHLEILAHRDDISEIIYISIERTRVIKFNIPNHTKIKHEPYYSIQAFRLLTKLTDFISIPFFIKSLIRKNKIDLLMCRSSIAGGMGYLTTLLIRIPFIVESFEPHSEYMRELGIWPKFGISYSVQIFLKKKQIKKALYLLTVSENYRAKLIEEGVNPGKVLSMPCSVDVEKFKFNSTDRTSIREKLGISTESIVGIYVGKFGDIYWDQEAFELFASAFDHFHEFFLIILSPHERDFVKARLASANISDQNVFHTLVSHDQVPAYLSASDLAFSTVRPTPYRKYCCPIKNGEYWANGLGIVSPLGIGDDSDIIKNENGGVLINRLSHIKWDALIPYMVNHQSGKGTQMLAMKYRSLSMVEDIYQRLLF